MRDMNHLKTLHSLGASNTQRPDGAHLGSKPTISSLQRTDFSVQGLLLGRRALGCVQASVVVAHRL